MNYTIELFRGIAAFMVLNSHYVRFLSEQRNLLHFLWTGVDFFFVISGFVFARTILFKNAHFIPYITRRFFRIYPLYICSLAFYYYITPEHAEKTTFLLKHILFLQTTSSLSEAFYFNPAYWSLPVEMEFYFFVPLLGWLCKKYGIAILWRSIPLLIGIKIFLTLNSNPQPAMFNVYNSLNIHLPGKIVEFLVGIFLYNAFEHYYERNLNRGQLFAVSMLGFLIILGLGMVFVTYGDEGINKVFLLRAILNISCAVGYGLILFSFLFLFKQNHPKMRSISTFAGNISYGVYLFHNLLPIALLKLNIPVSGVSAYFSCIIAVIILSLIFHYSVENPCRQFGRYLSKKYELHADKQRRGDHDHPHRT